MFLDSRIFMGQKMFRPNDLNSTAFIMNTAFGDHWMIFHLCPSRGLILNLRLMIPIYQKMEWRESHLDISIPFLFLKKAGFNGVFSLGEATEKAGSSVSHIFLCSVNDSNSLALPTTTS